MELEQLRTDQRQGTKGVPCEICISAWLRSRAYVIDHEEGQGIPRPFARNGVVLYRWLGVPGLPEQRNKPVMGSLP